MTNEEEDLSFQTQCIQEVLDECKMTPMEFLNDALISIHFLLNEITEEHYIRILKRLPEHVNMDLYVLGRMWIKMNEFENRIDKPPL